MPQHSSLTPEHMMVLQVYKLCYKLPATSSPFAAIRPHLHPAQMAEGARSATAAAARQPVGMIVGTLGAAVGSACTSSKAAKVLHIEQYHQLGTGCCRQLLRELFESIAKQAPRKDTIIYHLHQAHLQNLLGTIECECMLYQRQLVVQLFWG